MSDLNRDQLLVDDLLTSRKFVLLKPDLTDRALVSELKLILESSFQNRPLVVTLTGGPGGGKSTLREHLIQELEADGHKTDYMSTDDFGLYTREERNKLIAEEKINPWTAKDWELLNKLIKQVTEGKSVKAPIYDEATGNAVVVGEKKFPHIIRAGLHFLIVEGDFQPVENPDVKIYFHVPTNVRRENRVVRDMTKRNGGDPEKIKQSFDFRLESQYYPYTISNAEKADILILTSAERISKGVYPYNYSYTIYQKNR